MPLNELRCASACKRRVEVAVGIRQRGEALHDQARIVDAARGERGELIEIVGNRVALAGGSIGERARREREPGELLPEAIVHFLADAALLAAIASINERPNARRPVTSTANTSSAGSPPKSIARLKTSTSRIRPSRVRCRVSSGSPGCRGGLLELLRERLARWHECGDAHGQHLLAAPSILAQRRRVDHEKAQRAALMHPDRLRAALEDLRIAVLGLQPSPAPHRRAA